MIDKKKCGQTIFNKKLIRLKGLRVIVEFDNGKLIDLPICWIEPINDENDNLKSSKM